jgi:hypothetical protein
MPTASASSGTVGFGIFLMAARSSVWRWPRFARLLPRTDFRAFGFERRFLSLGPSLPPEAEG